MNILYTSDDNYAEICGISIVSLLENNKNSNNIKFFIFDMGLSYENKNRISKIVERYSREVRFIRVPDIEKIVGAKLYVGSWTLAVFARLFAASLLPANIEKIIHLDADTMVRRSISPLWNGNLNGNLVGGCKDGLPVSHKKSIFLEETDIYVNAGVLLIDLKAWRNANIEKAFIDFLRLFNGKLGYLDQDVINAVLKGRLKLFAPKYNSLSYYYEYNPNLLTFANIKDYYSNTELREAKYSPVIVHFAGIADEVKPWIKGNIHVFRDEYIKYRNITPWKHMPLRASISRNMT